MVISILYGVAFLFALLIAGGYILFFKNREKPFILLFSFIAVTNLGYLLVSISGTLKSALIANTLSYFGSVFLPMIMLLILLDSLEKKVSKSVSLVLTILAICVFLITATQLFPGLGLYYKNATLLFTEDGSAYLSKDYGSLHTLYPIYLGGYFLTMICFSLSAVFKKKMKSGKEIATLLVAVFINLGVWLAEQFTEFELEFLAISYLISEIFLLIFRQIIAENQKLRESIAAKEALAPKLGENQKPDEKIITFIHNLKTLTPTEKVVLAHYVSGKSTAETLEAMSITQNTLKYHNRNLYGKLFVSSRKELLETYREARKLQEDL